ncbi:MAG: hypothetical protein M3310_08675 [Actinomycetota bacterium]|nr:hypothetical protein [Actinomycetota bacterium]
MRLSRLIFCMLSAAVALGATALAGAARAPSADGTLSVRDAKAAIQLRLRGAVIGRLAQGQLTITDPVEDTATVVVRGAERQRDVNERTTVYTGTDIRFRIVDEERFNLRLNAKGINFSAVGRGDVWLDGRGDPDDGIYFDGAYSLNGSPFRSIPDERTRFDLETPPPAP